jgi:hypothetical protein
MEGKMKRGLLSAIIIALLSFSAQVASSQGYTGISVTIYTPGEKPYKVEHFTSHYYYTEITSEDLANNPNCIDCVSAFKKSSTNSTEWVSDIRLRFSKIDSIEFVSSPFTVKEADIFGYINSTVREAVVYFKNGTKGKYFIEYDFYGVRDSQHWESSDDKNSSISKILFH